MKSNICITFFIIILLNGVAYQAYSCHTNDNDSGELKKEIASINVKIEQIYLNENINSLISLYAPRPIFFPEYKPAIYDATNLRRFFKDWFETGDIKAYNKNIRTVEVYADYILEIGTFNLSYSAVGNPNGKYKGKYMVTWKRDGSGKLRMVSDAFGSDTYIESEAVPYAAVQVKKDNPTVQNADRSLLEIQEFDKKLLKVIAEGNGNARAQGFTDDAILMGNFDSIRVGMKSIRPKILDTYKPSSTFIVKHSYGKVIDLGDYILAYGHYKGGPTDSKMGGSFEGKMCNLMKRSANGKLLMYRQLGNRDDRQN